MGVLLLASNHCGFGQRPEKVRFVSRRAWACFSKRDIKVLIQEYLELFDIVSLHAEFEVKGEDERNQNWRRGWNLGYLAW